MDKWERCKAVSPQGLRCAREMGHPGAHNALISTMELDKYVTTPEKKGFFFSQPDEGNYE